jgi:hypothetical protein
MQLLTHLSEIGFFFCQWDQLFFHLLPKINFVLQNSYFRRNQGDTDLDDTIDIERKNRLLKACYLPPTSATF